MSRDSLRIAMLSVHSCPLGQLGTRDTGGMSVYIRELAAALGRQGHTIDVYTRVHDPRDGQFDSLGRNARLIHLRAGTDEEVHKLVVYSYLEDYACALEAFRKANNLTYDLIYSHYWVSAQLGSEVRLWWGVPHITMFHTLGAVKNSLGIGEDEPDLRIEKERELAQGAHRVIAATDREKAALMRYYDTPEDRIGVVPCGVNTSVFRPLDRSEARRKAGLGDEKVVLFAGRIEPLKGIDQLLKAVAQLNDEKVRLVVIGGNEDNQEQIDGLRALAGQLGISDHVSFPGTVKHELMPYYYAAADVCVVPSYYESFCLVAVEALACGTPVVATDVGDLRNIIRNGGTGFVLPDNAPVGLASKIDEVLSWPADQGRTRLIRASIANYAWQRVARQIVAEFRHVLAGASVDAR